MNPRAILFTLLFIGQGCANTPFSGTSTGNAMKMGLDSSAAQTEDAGLIAPDASGTDFTVLTATAQVERIAFPLPALLKCDVLGLSSPLSCDASGEGAEIVGEYTVDLIEAVFDPTLDDLTFPSMTFESLDVELSTLQVAGEFPYNNEVLSFSIDLAFSETFQFDSEEGFNLEDNDALNMILDTGDWLKDVGIIGCLDAGTLRAVDGHVTLTNECDNALDTLSTAVPDSASLHVD
jgi:hypothetical protein